MKGLYYHVFMLLNGEKEIVRTEKNYWVFSYASLSQKEVKLVKCVGENIFGIPILYQLTIPSKRMYKSDKWLYKYARNYLDSHEIDFGNAVEESRLEKALDCSMCAGGCTIGGICPNLIKKKGAEE